MSALTGLRGRLIVSCQAWEDDPFHGPGRMALFARAAVAGGAAGIRANGPDDVRDIKAATGVPVIAIQKRVIGDGRILITPSHDDAVALAAAGADAVALDCTRRGQRNGALDRIGRIRRELSVAVAADIATAGEALAAEAAGAQYALSTMRGYTDETADVDAFDPRFVAELARSVNVPVIAEGRMWSPQDAIAAIEAGAFAVVVGSAITRPRDITARFAAALAALDAERGCYVAIDLGGTNIKSGLALPDGSLLDLGVEPTAVTGGRTAILAQIGATAERLSVAAARRGLRILAAGVAVAGWPDPGTGTIRYATGNLPDWTGAPVGDTVAQRLGVASFVENDANATAMGEYSFGAARGVDTFVCLTLGTGIGGGCLAGGRLLRGGRFQANQVGHVVVEPGGRPCTCGQRGCLEPYANRTALLRYAGGAFAGLRELGIAAQANDPAACEAISTAARYLARGLEPVIQVLDPERIILSGGVVVDIPNLTEAVCSALADVVPRWSDRGIRVVPGSLGYHGGVAGAGAIARMRFSGVAAR